MNPLPHVSQHVCGDGSIHVGELEDCLLFSHALYIERRNRWVKEQEDAWERAQQSEKHEDQ